MAGAGGRARIASANEELNVDSVGRYAGCVVVEVTRAEPARITRTVFAPGLGPVAIEMQVQEGPKFVTKVKARLRAVTKPGRRAGDALIARLRSSLASPADRWYVRGG